MAFGELHIPETEALLLGILLSSFLAADWLQTP